MLDRQNKERTSSINRTIQWFWQTIFIPIIHIYTKQKRTSHNLGTSSSESILVRLSKPSKLKNAILVCIGVQIISCTSIHKFSNYDELHSKIQNKRMLITLTDSTTFHASEIVLAEDSTRFQLKGVDGKTTIPTSTIYSLSKINRLKGAGQGFLSLFLIIGVPLAILNYSDGDDDPDFLFAFTAEAKAVFGLISGAFLGFILGAPIGALNGSKDLYVITPKPSKQDSSKSNITPIQDEL